MSRFKFALLGLIAGLVMSGFYSNASAEVTTSNEDRGYTNKSIHDSGDISTYKKPEQKSYTSPFDYGPVSTVRHTPAPQPTGKCNCFTFDATKSHDVDGQKLTIAWDFGDGATGDQAVMTHCYDKAGDYNVTLTVKDSSGMVCDTGVTSAKVNANFPPTAEAGDDAKACVGEAITFDGSNSSSSSPATYTWDFGDGEKGEGARVSHAYQQAGTYRVFLTVDDGKNTECSTAVDSTTASIAASVTTSVQGASTACIGRTVSFSANSTGGARNHRWDFGDGTTWEGGASASHAYQKAGDYTVTVTADNGQGFPCSAASAATKITVSEPPVAVIGEIASCLINEGINFDGSKSSSSAGTLNYRWNFGDGETAEGDKVTHAYSKAGNYRVTLTVTDSQGGDCSAASTSVVVPVNTLPEAVIEVR